MLADHAKRSKPVRSRSIETAIWCRHRHVCRLKMHFTRYPTVVCGAPRCHQPFTLSTDGLCVRAHVYPMHALFMRSRNYSTKIDFSHLTRPDTCSECARTFNKLSLSQSRSGRAASVLFMAILLPPSAPPEKERDTEEILFRRGDTENSRLTLFRLRQCRCVCVAALTTRLMIMHNLCCSSDSWRKVHNH